MVLIQANHESQVYALETDQVDLLDDLAVDEGFLVVVEGEAETERESTTRL